MNEARHISAKLRAASYDIFNFSLKILNKQFMRNQYRNGLNMMLQNPLDLEELTRNEQ